MAENTILTLKEKGILIKNGDKFEISDDIEVIGVYFSAHWCPPCQKFTPKLADSYNKWTGEEKKFEIIFVSFDKDQDSFNDYFGTMPWAAVKFEDTEDLRQTIAQQNGVSGIPRLIIFDKSGGCLKENAGGIVESDEFPF